MLTARDKPIKMNYFFRKKWVRFTQQKADIDLDLEDILQKVFHLIRVSF